MPKPTLAQRTNFKTWLRYYKSKFANTTIPEFYLDDIITTKAVGITTTDNITVVPFINHDTVDVSSSISNQSLFYLPALINDTVTLGVSTFRAKLKFGAEGDNITFDGISYGLNDTIPVRLSGNNLIVKGLGGALLQSTPAPAYSIGVSTTSVNEGSSVDFTVNVTAVSAGTTVYYSTTGTTNAADFGDGSLTGSFNIVGTGSTTGVATITRSIAADIVAENQETFRLQIREGSTSGTVVATSPLVTVNNVTSYYTITESATSVNEGSSVSFTVNTVNVGTPSTLYYSTGGTASAADFSNNSLSGSFSLVSTGSTTGIATFVRSIATDFDTESGEVFNIVIRTGSVSGTAVTTSSNITIGDTVPSVTITESATSVDEGGSVTFTISGSNIANGTYYYTISEEEGTIASTDFNPANLDGSFTVNNNSGSLTITLAEDLTTEGTDKFRIQIRRDSISGNIIATSNTITVGDSSQGVGSNSSGKTFGPVQVNRDDGSVANASDWYAIANLDQIPDGSSIALFIDGSGSMTQGTVQASYNKLLTKLNARGITITTVTNSAEDWITPFLVDLP